MQIQIQSYSETIGGKRTPKDWVISFTEKGGHTHSFRLEDQELRQLQTQVEKAIPFI